MPTFKNQRLFVDGVEISPQQFNIEVEQSYDRASPFISDYTYRFASSRYYKVELTIYPIGIKHSEDSIYLYTKEPELEEWQDAYAIWCGKRTPMDRIAMKDSGEFESKLADHFKAGYDLAKEMYHSRGMKLEDYE